MKPTQNSARQAKVKVHEHRPSDRLERFWEFHPWALSYSRVIPGMQDRVIRPARMLFSCRPPDTIGRPVCGVEFQVTMDSRAKADLPVQHVGICLTSWVVSRILHFSGNRIPFYWLTVNVNVNYNLGVNNSEREFCSWTDRRSGEGQENMQENRDRLHAVKKSNKISLSA